MGYLGSQLGSRYEVSGSWSCGVRDSSDLGYIIQGTLTVDMGYLGTSDMEGLGTPRKGTYLGSYLGSFWEALAG